MLASWKEVVFEEFPHVKEITERMIDSACGQRLSTRRFSTSKQLEETKEYYEEAWRQRYN